MKPAAQIPSPARSPVIAAHAGCMGTRPNSREAIVAAFSSAAQVVEVDIRATKDGAVVLAHDDSLRLERGGRAELKSILLEDVMRHAAGSGDAAPLELDELFDLAAKLDATLRPGRAAVLNLDVKETAVLPRAAALVRRRGLEDSVFFSGLEKEGIETAMEQLSGLRYLFNADEFLPVTGAREEDMAEACSLASKFGCYGINLEWTRASGLLVEIAQSRGLPVTLWTVDREEDMKIVLDYGPDSMTTNRPDMLAALIDRHSEEKRRFSELSIIKN
jgi:glycerophosphoryl diester phosphodiesterase